MRKLVFVVVALSLTACATINGTPTAANCQAAREKLAIASGTLAGAQAAIPILQTAAQNALKAANGDPNDKAYVAAQAALGVAQASIPALQAVLQADAGVVASQCANFPPG